MKYIFNIQLFGGRGAISGLSGGGSLQGLLGHMAQIKGKHKWH